MADLVTGFYRAHLVASGRVQPVQFALLPSKGTERGLCHQLSETPRHFISYVCFKFFILIYREFQQNPIEIGLKMASAHLYAYTFYWVLLNFSDSK